MPVEAAPLPEIAPGVDLAPTPPRRPMQPTFWRWVSSALVVVGFAALLACDNYQEEVDSRQTVTLVVTAHSPTAAANRREPFGAMLEYEQLERRAAYVQASQTGANAAGEVRQYEFSAVTRGLRGITLRGNAQVELIRVIGADGSTLVRLGPESFRPIQEAGQFAGAVLIVLRPASANSGEATLWTGINVLRVPAGPWAARFIAVWTLFYSAVFIGLAWLVIKLFEARHSLDKERWQRLWHRAGRWVTLTRPWQLGLAVGLALAMAVVSANNAHPDEYMHCAAARFYRLGNWLPPAIGDARIADTFSRNGMSYMQEWDITYLIAGKLSLLTNWLVGREDVSLRLIAVGYLAALAFLAGRGERRASAWMLLICPQLWYVFSCVNGDALPLFLSVLTVWQLGLPDSALQRYLRDGKKYPWGAIGMGLLLGLLAVSKRNYYAIILLAGAVAALDWFFEQDSAVRRRLLTRWSVIFAVVATIWACRALYDVQLYHFHKAEKLAEVRDAMALPGFNPTKKEPNSYWGYQLHDQGVSLSEMLGKPRFRTETFMSFAGLYGWMNLANTPTQYQWALYLYRLLAATMALGLIWHGARRDFALVACCAGIGVALAAVYFAFSWFIDYQPQARYLFPILPMVALVGLRCRRAFAGPAVLLTSAAIFALSVCSFVFNALTHISK